MMLRDNVAVFGLHCVDRREGRNNGPDVCTALTTKCPMACNLAESDPVAVDLAVCKRLVYGA